MFEETKNIDDHKRSFIIYIMRFEFGLFVQETIHTKSRSAGTVIF